MKVECMLKKKKRKKQHTEQYDCDHPNPQSLLYSQQECQQTKVGKKNICAKQSHQMRNFKCVQSLQSLQLCLTPCDPMDCSPPGSSVHGTLQAKTLEWVAMPSCRGPAQPRGQSWVSCTADRFLTHLATWEAQGILEPLN